ncbi:MAG: hypothetical protein NTZ21_06705 [Actinobacteria bacterium]|nr:hypothetical protein [Actinomycetota bacterium]
MPASSPDEVFHTAQQAMVRGDWEVFFRCLTRARLQAIATMVIPMVGDDPAGRFADLCRTHGVSDDRLDAVRDAGAAVVVSAQRARAADVPTEQMLAESQRHRELVTAHTRATKVCVQAIADLAAFVAASERYRRETSGGGSISSHMFVDETLTDVVITGTKASGVRNFPRGQSEGLAFALERGEWRIGGATRR